MQIPEKVLLCEPLFFDVMYEGNIYMKDLPLVDLEKAVLQWSSLKEKYEKLGFEIKIIPAVKNLTDMVFTANQSFPFLNNDNEKCVILSRMRNSQRKDEVEHFREFYINEGFKVFELSDSIKQFESMGDALIDYKNERIFGGFGFRTDEKVYDELNDITGMGVTKLKLVSDKFYHLDTCFSILGNNEVLICENGFDKASLKKIHDSFDKVYKVSEEENMKSFLCNCHCPDGKNIIVHKNDSSVFKNELSGNYIIIEIETSEFMKSGGSVFCMKMMLW